MSDGVERNQGELLREVEELRRRNAELEARLAAGGEGEANGRYSVDDIEMAAYGVSTEGKLFYVNDAACRSLGYSRGELIGMPVSRIDPDWAPEDREAEIERIKRQGSATFESRHRRRDGTEFPVLVTVNYYAFEGGEHFFSLARDISEHKNTETRLRRQRDFAETLIETARMIVLVLDPEGRIVRFNRYMEQLSGYRLDEVHGKDWFSTFLPPEDHKRTRELLRQSLDDLRIEGRVNAILTKGGERRDIEWYASALRDDAGTVIGVLAVGQDITGRLRAERSRQEAESLYRAVFEGSLDGIAFCTPEGRLVDWNRAYQQMLGYSDEELARMTIQDVTPAKWHQWEKAELIDEQILNNGWTPTYEKEYIRKDGMVFPVEITAYRLDPAGDRPTLIWGMARDVTERKAAEQERQSLQDQLHQAQKLEAIGELASGIAHDVNNLLTVIFANIEYIKERASTDDSVTHCANMIEEAGRQATAVTRSLLMFSRAMPAEKKLIDLGETVRGSSRILARLLPDMVELELDASVDPPVRAYADPNQIQQVLINLAINARDAMPGGGTLKIGLSRVAADLLANHGEELEESPVYAVLTVTDTGTGMTDEVATRLFEPFFSTKTRAQGTGLGLAVAHGIITNHGGTIDVRSQPGKGSTFTIILPCATVEDALETVGASEGESTLGNGTILLAEDNPYVQTAVMSMLETLGYEVIMVDDGLAVIEAAHEHGDRIDLFVLDIDLPKRRGIDSLRDLRDEGVMTPAVLITGGADQSVEDEFDERTTLLRKPFQMKELGQCIQQFLPGRDTGSQPT